MHEYFAHKKPLIARELRSLLESRAGPLGRINLWGPDLVSRFLSFCLKGKMIRGGLLLLGWEMHAHRHAGTSPRRRREAAGGRAAPRHVVQAAAAIEILHSSLLIHDDIMDNDRLRRGDRTIFAQYEQAGRRAHAADPTSFGRSMGTCAGDAGYFLACESLARLGIDAERKASLLTLVSRELTYVAVAQMQDLAFAASHRVPSRDEVLALYLYKTARYSFSLPLMAGALIAGATAADQRRLGELGERLGVIFQVRDDEMGIFGTERQTGKPVGSDIREGKKTLLYLELLRRARGPQRRTLMALFGKPDLTMAESRKVGEAIEKIGARATMKELAEGLAEEARRIISSLPIPAEHARILNEICDGSLRRKR
ncbi:MAG TPA: polyprenyl synthetase family protein [Spirochaetia bacterium]|nr:polyprenyl synthetase family protein [Spirochaetia bacterium]